MARRGTGSIPDPRRPDRLGGFRVRGNRNAPAGASETLSQGPIAPLFRRDGEAKGEERGGHARAWPDPSPAGAIPVSSEAVTVESLGSRRSVVTGSALHDLVHQRQQAVRPAGPV